MGDLPESEFPLRLIDVQSTLRSEGGLCFHSGPKDWNFYIVSHTWSRAIKELSEYIGEKINRGVTMGTEESMREYNEAFQNADLRSKEGYLDLRKFLEVLMEELLVQGVKGNPIRIWFDVICINQEDSEEKSREIRRMAAYYKHSKGCYVLTHGVGQGYHLWPGQDQEDNDLISLPRWFTRVWTLQELVLPKKVMFLVAGFNESTATWANQYIENHGPRLCDCWLSSSSVDEASNILIWRELRHADLSRELRVAELRESVMRGADQLS